jgi:branched-chain amino acid transport system substrate-binding protein
MKRSLLWPASGAAVALALVLTGCGEAASGSNAGSSDPDSGSTTIDDSIGSQFSGGTAGEADSSATPITIGMINQEGGQVSNPEASAAVQAAFDYINAEQGGIGGRPLELTVCKVTSSEEEAQQCAQQFLNDDSISVVLQGGLNVGSNAVHATLDGAKPDLVTIANPGTDTTAENTFVVNPSVIAGLPAAAQYASDKGYESLGIVVSDNPGDIAISQVAQGIFEGFGLTTKVTTFPAGSTDLTSAFTAAVGGEPDALAPLLVTSSGCIAAAKALDSIGTDIPVLASSLCATENVRDGYGDFPEWDYGATFLSLFAPDDTGQLDFYRAVMAEYAGDDAVLGVNAPPSFGSAFVLAKALNSIEGDITPESISTALANYSDGVLLGAPTVDFGSVPNMPTLSGLSFRYYVYEGNDEWSATDWQNVGG